MRILFVYSILIVSTLLKAESMDLSTHTMLIEKLEKGKGSSSVNLRLADLYSDRARLKELQEIEQKCNNCMKSKEDRKKAIGMYQNVFSKLESDEKERVFSQIAQNHIVLGETHKANQYYHQVLKDKQSSRKLKALAEHALAEQFFFNHKYEDAYMGYKIAIKLDPQLNNVMTRYRLAWCEFNAGKFELAKKHLEQILSSGEEMDKQLRFDIARDFAKFTAKGPINQSTLTKVDHLSPDSEAKANVELLASELDRLVRSTENLIANYYILENFEMTALDRASAYLRLSQAEQSLKRFAQATESLQKASDNYLKGDCSKDEFRCSEFKEKAKKYILYWSKVEKDRPSPSLLKSFEIYLATFKNDHDMYFLAAQTFDKLKNHAVAQKFYLKTAELVQKKDDPKEKKLFVATLDGAITAGEESKSKELRKTAYSRYIELNPKGEKVYQARYQLGYLHYEEHKYDQALSVFNELLGEYKDNKAAQNKKVAKQSADLVLDIYALKKDNIKVMNISQEFLKIFPNDRIEYVSIYRKALLHEANASLEGNKKSNDDRVQLLALMKALHLRGVAEKEQILVLETQVRLARAVNDLFEVQRGAKALLELKTISQKTKDFAYDQVIWASEVTLNFFQAFRYAELRYSSPYKTKTQLIKLAILAELAGKNPRFYYEEYLRHPHAVLEGNNIRAKIIQTSQSPWKQIKDYLPKMKASPQLLSELALETYARHRNTGGAQQVLDHRNVAVKPAGVMLRRHLEIPEFYRLQHKVSKHIIGHSSSSRMQANISERMNLIGKLEQFANEAIQRHDFVLQMASLGLLKEQKERLARDLKTLPVPRELNANEKVQYAQILSQKIQSIEQEAHKIGERMNGFWAKETYTKEMEKSFEQGFVEFKKLISEEARVLHAYAPESKRDVLKNMMQIPSLPRNDLLQARSDVKAKPFDTSTLARLRDLERAHNNLTQVAFLELRLNDLSKGSK